MSTNQTDPENEFLKVGEVSRTLRTSTRTVREMIKDFAFPGAVKPRKEWLIPRADLEALLRPDTQATEGGAA